METIIALSLASFCLLYTGCKLISSYNGLLFTLGFISVLAVVFSAIFTCVIAFNWFAAEHKAALINKQLGTSYTQEDIFYASGYIEEVREMHRKRIELNGDLINGIDGEAAQ